MADRKQPDPTSSQLEGSIEWEELRALDGDAEPTADEVAEAQALHRWISKSTHDGGVSEEVQAGAALVHLAAAAKLGADAQERILKEVMAHARVSSPSPVSRVRAGARAWYRRSWVWFTAAMPLAVAAALLYLNPTSNDGLNESKSPVAVLPPPTAELLTAQAAWLASNTERAPFEAGMKTYRTRVLAALERP